MAIKQVGQAGFGDGWLAPGAGVNMQLERLDALVKWYRFEKLVSHLRDGAGPGRPGYPALLLVKALLLQAMYGLSDRELEGFGFSVRQDKGMSSLFKVNSYPTIAVFNRKNRRYFLSGFVEKDKILKLFE